MMNRLNLFFCPICGNVAIAYGKPSVACCGMELAPVVVSESIIAPTVTEMDGEYFVTFDCPMTKDHYIAAVVVERYDRVELIRLFAEQDAQVRVSQVKGAKITVLYRQQDKVWADCIQY